MDRSRKSLLGTVSAAVVLLAAGIGGSSDTSAATDGSPRAAVRGPRVVLAGDIACAPGGRVSAVTCRQAATARLAASLRPRYVVTLGDEQYENGRLAAFRRVYARTWGRFNSINKPVPGNHDYHVNGAAGYFAYFARQTRAPGYYAWDANGWRIYALNSNCSKLDCAAEAAWLDRDMTAHPRACSALTMHHPRYSSDSQHGDSPEVGRFWAVALRHHADLALAGHAHDYERFRAMDASGNITGRGMVSFVVGTGGKSLYTRHRARKGSVRFANRRAGVLALRLGRRGYAWTFKTIDRRTIDSGVRSCH